MSRFDYVKYDDASMIAQKELKALFEELVEAIENETCAGRPQALALTKLEEAYMWCGKAIRDDQIVRNGAAVPQEERKNG